jgi:hypothetical protein
MKTYKITNKTSGQTMGNYRGEGPDAALLAMIRDGGGEAVDDPADWTVEELRTRKVTLTGRAPVSIVEEEWPVVASASGDSYSGCDYGRYQQALGQGECDRYYLTVRQHADGRTLVYGVLDAAISARNQPARGEDRRGGYLLKPGDGMAPMSEEDLAARIRQVGEECELPDSIIRECVADLPAEEL